jgi:hypothetical protein
MRMSDIFEAGSHTAEVAVTISGKKAVGYRRHAGSF